MKLKKLIIWLISIGISAYIVLFRSNFNFQELINIYNSGDMQLLISRGAWFFMFFALFSFIAYVVINHFAKMFKAVNDVGKKDSNDNTRNHDDNNWKYN